MESQVGPLPLFTLYFLQLVPIMDLSLAAQRRETFYVAFSSEYIIKKKVHTSIPFMFTHFFYIIATFRTLFFIPESSAAALHVEPKQHI